MSSIPESERRALTAFQIIMFEKIGENVDKGGWESVGLVRLLSLLKQEVLELHRAIGEKSVREIGREAADVANFAMMIADVAGALSRMTEYSEKRWSEERCDMLTVRNGKTSHFENCLCAYMLQRTENQEANDPQLPMTLPISESDRQLVILALAVLSLVNPGFDYALNLIAMRIDNVKDERGEMYEGFRVSRKDRVNGGV